MRHFTACHAGRILAKCTSSRTGPCLSHLAENINETYCCIQILTIPTVDFMRQTAPAGSTSQGMPHDVNVHISTVCRMAGLWHLATGNWNCLKPTLWCRIQLPFQRLNHLFWKCSHNFLKISWSYTALKIWPEGLTPLWLPQGSRRMQSTIISPLILTSSPLLVLVHWPFFHSTACRQIH